MKFMDILRLWFIRKKTVEEVIGIAQRNGLSENKFKLVKHERPSRDELFNVKVQEIYASFGNYYFKMYSDKLHKYKFPYVLDYQGIADLENITLGEIAEMGKKMMQFGINPKFVNYEGTFNQFLKEYQGSNKFF